MGLSQMVLFLKDLILAKETLLIKAHENDSCSVNLNNVIYTFHFQGMEGRGD